MGGWGVLPRPSSGDHQSVELTTAQIAQRCNVTDRAVRYWIEQGRLRGRLEQAEWLVQEEELERALRLGEVEVKER